MNLLTMLAVYLTNGGYRGQTPLPSNDNDGGIMIITIIVIAAIYFIRKVTKK